jgi:predicted alpha/beta hydrolase family esterase
MNHLNIPGLNNSGPEHWQTLWEETFPQQFKRVQQKNWSAPAKNEWVEALHTTIKNYDSPVVLVAHSLGCVTVAHWANENKSPVIAGALLVAPADAERSVRECFKTFCPVPKSKLPFPSIVVASTNDPYAAIENSAKLAAYWGSKFVCVGDKGHINAQSGLDQWKEGLSLLSVLTNSHTSIVNK